MAFAVAQGILSGVYIGTFARMADTLARGEQRNGNPDASTVAGCQAFGVYWLTAEMLHRAADCIPSPYLRIPAKIALVAAPFLSYVPLLVLEWARQDWKGNIYDYINHAANITVDDLADEDGTPGDANVVAFIQTIGQTILSYIPATLSDSTVEAINFASKNIGTITQIAIGILAVVQIATGSYVFGAALIVTLGYNQLVTSGVVSDEVQQWMDTCLGVASFAGLWIAGSWVQAIAATGVVVLTAPV